MSSRCDGDLVHLHRGVLVTAPPDVRADEGEQHGPLGIGHLAAGDPLVRRHEVVVEGAGLHATVEQVLEMGGDVVGMDGRIDDRPVPLGGVERADQVEPERLLGVEQRSAGERAVAHPPGLGAHERRRHHDSPVEHDGVHAQVVAVDLPAPRLVAARFPEDRHEVRPLAERLVVTGQLGQQFVQPHDRAGLAEATR